MADVGVVEPGNRVRFAREALRGLGVGDLDRDVAAQAGSVGTMHLAHATLTARSKNFVGTEFAGYGKGHLKESASVTRRESG